MKKIMQSPLIVASALMVFGASAAQAQSTTYKRDIPDSLAKQATVTESAAAATAQKRVPKGTIQAVELEREGGRLLYSFELKVPGKTGIDEVNVDAKTGKSLRMEHESPAKERKEAAVDAKEAKAKAAKHTP
ncbi:MAG: PepSY domain-containing protein [Gemmatimonadaceae bacterium]|nr:PepSY domain-containing protein [Gemmatimonadaceae bacterium]